VALTVSRWVNSDERATLTQSGKARFADDLSRTVRKIEIMRKLMAQVMMHSGSETHDWPTKAAAGD
jgi:hypothetical protein